MKRDRHPCYTVEVLGFLLFLTTLLDIEVTLTLPGLGGLVGPLFLITSKIIILCNNYYICIRHII